MRSINHQLSSQSACLLTIVCDCIRIVGVGIHAVIMWSTLNKMAMLTANWDVVGSTFYRCTEVYCMPWKYEVDLKLFKFTGAPFAGPIALIRDDNVSMKAHSGQTPTAKPIVYIYTSAGHLISQFRWNSGHVISLHWSCQEELVCVQDDGSILIYDIFGSFKKSFNLGNEVKECRVLESQSFRSASGTGVAVLTANYCIHFMSNINNPCSVKLSVVQGNSKAPYCWTIFNRERSVIAIVAANRGLYQLEQGGEPQMINPPLVNTSSTVFMSMAVSFNGKKLALITDQGLLWIGTTDLRTTYCEVSTNIVDPFSQFVWCGADAVVCEWENQLLLTDLKGHSTKYSYETCVRLIGEADGVRIISQVAHEFLQKVPFVVEQLFRIGSMEPGAMLFGASKEFQRKSEKADLYFGEIKNSLDAAVEQCIEAAGHQFDSQNQKMLLRAASFGKCFLSDCKPEPFVEMCQSLRILNAVGDYTVGIPLSYVQLQYLTVRVLIDRLIYRRLFALAMRICQHLKLPESEGSSRVLAHWACYKAEQTDVDDDVVARTIAQKLGDSPGVSYSDIASKAYSKGRTQLAIKLLDFEARAAEQVPLLMQMDYQQLALDKAVESGDTDLVYTVILHLKDRPPKADFLMAIRSKPIAYALYQQYCRNEQMKTLQDLFHQEDDYFEEANCRLQEAYSESRFDARLSAISGAQESYTKGKYEWAAKACEEQIKLMRQQRKLEKDNGQIYLDQSVHRSIYQLLMEKNQKMAEQLRKDFKVPDRRFWWLKIKALAEDGDWLELERFSKSKKSPIGYEPFVDVCVENNNKTEAQKYLPKILPENKVKCYVKTGQLDLAADVAFAQRNENELNYILNRCTPSHVGLAEKIMTMKAQLGKR